MAEGITEAATKKHRGRPSVFTRYLFGNQESGDGLRREWRGLYPEASDRTLANTFYYTDAQEMAEKSIGRDWFKQNFTTSRGALKNFGIAEQVGRMHLQDGYEESYCMRVLYAAVRMRTQEGWKAKRAESWIRNGRKCGKFFESEMED